MNESYPQPSLPAAAHEGVIKGMYCMQSPASTPQVRLLGSGAILREVVAAARLLNADWGVEAEVWSVTSLSELAREARETERWNRLHPTEPARTSYVAGCLAGATPIVAATDYVSAYPRLIAADLDALFVALGTDGFGRSDTRSALRRFFEVDRHHVAVAALAAVAKMGGLAERVVAEALAAYDIPADAAAPWRR